MLASRSDLRGRFSISGIASGREPSPFYKKAIAIFIIVAFLFNIADLAPNHSPLRGSGSGQAWAITEPNNILTGSGMGGGASPGQLISDLSNIEIPLSLGYVKERYLSGTDKPVIVYIQDAHCNYSCQKSIESIVNYFNGKYKIDLAAVEGGAGNYDYSIFTSIPDIDLREKIANYFVREGRVTGVDLFALMNPDKLSVKGLEEQSLYEKNLSVYRESLTYKDNVDKYLAVLRHYIENLKPPIFSSDIEKLDNEKKLYNDNKNKLKDYVLYLNNISEAKNIDINRFKNLNKLITLIEDEGNINFKRAEKEREILIDLLTKKLSKLEISILVEKSIDFKENNISASDFYEYLFRKAESANIDVSEYPNIISYKEYVDKYDNVEKDVFFEEIFDVEHCIAENLSVTKDERNLYFLSDDLGILDKLFSVSLTRRLYDYYYGKKDSVTSDSFVSFIKEKAPWYNMSSSINPEVQKIDLYKDKITNFYIYSFERDTVFMENLERYSSGENALFMVTGGFHTENVTELLKKNGYSYLLITPKIVSEKDNPYFHLLSGGLSPIESLINEFTAALALRSPFSEMGIPQDAAELSGAVQALREISGEQSIFLDLPLGVVELTFNKPKARAQSVPGLTWA